MSGFLQLPTDVLSFALYPYLSLTDITRVDMAVTNHTLRPLLYHIYPYLDLTRVKERVSKSKLMWFFQRSLCVSEVVLDSHLLSYEITDIFEYLTHHSSECVSVVSLDVSACIRNIHVSHMVQVSEWCSNLTHLVLKGYTRQELFSHSHTHSLRSLRSLDLSKSVHTDELTHSIATHCSGLLSLTLNECHTVRDDTIVTIARACTSLTHLHLVRCDKLHDTALNALSTHCHSLTHLNVKRVHKLTDVGVSSLSRCTALTTLDLTGCSKITTASLVALTGSCTALTTLTLSKCLVVINGERVTSPRVISLVQ